MSDLTEFLIARLDQEQPGEEADSKAALLDYAIELTRDGNERVGREIMHRLALAYVMHPDYIEATRV